MSKKKNNVSGNSGAFAKAPDFFEQWVSAHSKLILICSGAIVIIAVIIAIAVYFSKQAELHSFTKFADAETADEIQKVLAEYPSGPAAATARFRLSREYIDQKKFNEAYTVLSAAAADKSVAPYVRSKALMDANAVLELQGKTQESAAAYAAMANDMSVPEALRIQAAYSAGRLYASLKNISEARKYLERAKMAKNRVMSAGLWAELAERELDRLSVPLKKIEQPAAKTPVAKAAQETANTPVQKAVSKTVKTPVKQKTENKTDNVKK